MAEAVLQRHAAVIVNGILLVALAGRYYESAVASLKARRSARIGEERASE
jgi:hypothetical protein